MQTLTEIEQSSIQELNSRIPGNDVAKEALKHALPFERAQLRELAEDKINDNFVEGYDDNYRKIDMDAVNQATKKMNGRIVPAFAIYDVFGNGVCEIEKNIDTSHEDDASIAFLDKADRFKFKAYQYTRIAVILSMLLMGLSFIGCFIASICTGFSHSTINIMDIVSGVSAFGLLFIAGPMCEKDLKKTIKFIHEPKGLMPRNVAENIKNLKSKFDRIYVIEEAHCWEIEDSKIEIIQNEDPLVVGKYGENYYIIDKYDVTPLESLMASEFSV